MFFDVHGLPGVADPDIVYGSGSDVSLLGGNVVGQSALLRLVLVLFWAEL